jgi:hypothetical protein
MIVIKMPCSNCKKPGHNRRRCPEDHTTVSRHAPAFTYVDDEGSLNPIYKADGLEDWMKPASVSHAAFDAAEESLWKALGAADKGRGLTFEEVIAVVSCVLSSNA